MEIIIEPTAKTAAARVARIIGRELQTNRRLVLGLATGRTMESVYAGLVQMHRDEGLDFSQCRAINLDEYAGLSGNDPHSYRHYMNQHLFRKVNIDLRNTHLPDGKAKDLEAESTSYERLIQRSGGIDLQLLGIGHNGHLGFNEPPSPFDSRTRVVTLSAETRERNASLFPDPDQVPRRAITMGLGTILEARHCVLLAFGGDKAEIVAKALEGPVTPSVSASVLQRHPRCTVVVDQAAGKLLQAPKR